MEDFEAMINSLGEHIVDTIGRDHLRRVLVSGDDMAGTAEITIELSEPSWAEQSRAIDRMVELRGLFLDDVSLEYRFVNAGELGQAVDARAKQLSFA